MPMKSIQLSLDESLLKRWDRLSSYQKRSRSAVLSQAAVEDLKSHEPAAITARYQAGYGGALSIDEELDEWASEGAVPKSA